LHDRSWFRSSNEEGVVERFERCPAGAGWIGVTFGVPLWTLEEGESS